MPDILDAQGPAVRTDIERARIAALAHEHAIPLPQMLGDLARAGSPIVRIVDLARGRSNRTLEAFALAQEDTIPAVAVRNLARAGFEPDPTWQLDQKSLDQLKDGIDYDLVINFADAVSYEHALLIREQALDQTRRRRTLASMGWQGTALTIGAHVLDPVTLAAGFATGGASEVPAAGLAARSIQLARAGLLAGVPFGAIETYRASQDPSVTGGDVLAATLGGVGFGVGGAATRSSGRIARFLAAGAGQALPAAAVEAAAGKPENELMWSAAFQFLAGGAMHAAHPTILETPVAVAARRVVHNIEFETVTGKTPGEPGASAAAGTVLSDKGRAVFHEQAGRGPALRRQSAVGEGSGMSESDLFAAGAVPAGEAATPVRTSAVLSPDRLARTREWLTGQETAALERIKQRKIPGGRGTGATTLPDDLIDVGIIAAARLAKGGVATAEAVRDAVRAAIAEFSPAHADRAPEIEAHVQRLLAQEPPAEVQPSETSPGTISTLEPKPINLPPAEQGDLSLAHATDARTAMVRVVQFAGLDIGLGRVDMPGMVGRSDVPSIRRVNNMIGFDPLAKAGGSPSIYTADEWAKANHNAHLAEVYAAGDATYGQHLKASGGAALTRAAFMETVGKAVRRPSGTFSQDPSVNAHAEKVRSWFDRLRRLAVRHGVPGMAEVEPNQFYLSRLGNREAIDAAIAAHGEDAVRGLVAESIRRGSPDLAPGIADKLARVWLRRVGNASDADPAALSRIFEPDQKEVLARVLREEFPAMTDAELSSVLFRVTPQEKPSGSALAFDRARLSMDETFSAAMPSGAVLGIEDLLYNNAEAIQALYSHHVHHAAAISTVVRDFGDPNVTTPAQLLGRLERDAAQRGLLDSERTNLAKVALMLDITAGKPISAKGPVGRLLRAVTGAQFVRTMSGLGSGMQNTSELAPALAEIGPAAVFKQFPALGSLFRRAADGRLDHALARDVATLGLGVERLARRPQPRLHTEDGSTAPIGAAEELIAKASRLASDVSVQSFTQDYMQRAVGALVLQRTLDDALSGSTPSSSRLAAAGLNPNQAGRINAQLKAHALHENGVLTTPNWGAWTDIEAASLHRFAVTRTVNRLVQSSNPTAYAAWMHTDLGRLFAQLRTFGFGAWTNKLLYGVQQRDAAAFASFTVATVSAGITYIARTYYDSIGKVEREKFLRQRLSRESIAKASFSRAAYSALIPAAADAGAGVLGYDAPFAYARASGVGQRGGRLARVLGNPTADWADAALGIPGAIVNPIIDHSYHFSQADVKNIRDGLFVPNAFGLHNAIDQLARTLPRQSKKDRRP